MTLLDIKDYIKKTAVIISSIAEIEVLIVDDKGNVVVDTDMSVYEYDKKVSDKSILMTCIKERRNIISYNSRFELEGCKQCVFRDRCNTNAVISFPIMEGREVYGGIGIYAENREQIQNLVKRERSFFEFTQRISELILLKMHEQLNTEKLRQTVATLKNNSCVFPFENILGSSEQIKELKEKAKKFAKGNSTILIEGESGTGKELFARAIHTASKQKNGPFIAINCAALPENLIESELFGYEDGAFTGARRGGKLGKFELADKGTLFLDEVGELPLYIQAKFLRVLQEKSVQKIGGERNIPIDVRIIAATNKNLEKMVLNGEFREDLYYRLNVIPLHIPNLIERRSDITEIAEYFLHNYASIMKKDIFGFTDEAIYFLNNYAWPGNIRELQNAIEFAVNVTSSEYITVEDLPAKTYLKKDNEQQFMCIKPLKDVEQDYIKEALQVYGNSKKGKEKAAEALGIGIATLYRKIRDIE